MSRTLRNDRLENTDRPKRQRGRRDREIALRVVRRREPDLRRMGRALIALAIREAEAEAEQRTSNRPTEHETSSRPGEEPDRDS